jgi:hypothetical protein
MKLNLNDIINECEEHINKPNCEGCPFGGPDGECLIQRSPAGWSIEFLAKLLDDHLSESKSNPKHLQSLLLWQFKQDCAVCIGHRRKNGLDPLPEPLIEYTCEKHCTAYLTCPLLNKGDKDVKTA